MRALHPVGIRALPRRGGGGRNKRRRQQLPREATSPLSAAAVRWRVRKQEWETQNRLDGGKGWAQQPRAGMWRAAAQNHL